MSYARGQTSDLRYSELLNDSCLFNKSLFPDDDLHYSEVARLASQHGNDLLAMYTLLSTLNMNEDMTQNSGLIELYRKNCGDYELLKRMPNMEFRKKFCIRFVRLVYSLLNFRSLEGVHEVWSSVEEFLTSNSTTESDVLRIVSIIIFVVHLHKRRRVKPGYHFVHLQRYAVLVIFEFGVRLLKICASVKDVFSTPVLPGLLAFVEWYVYSPDMIPEKVESTTHVSLVKNQDVEERISRARPIFWRYCQNFLKSTWSGNNMQGHDDVISSCRNNDELVDRVALWEDRVLQGDAPFDPVRSELKLSRSLSCGADENKNRIARIIDAVRKAVRNSETSQIPGDPKRQEINQGGINIRNFKGKQIVDVPSRSNGPSCW